MAHVKDPGMFSDLTKGERGLLFAMMGSAAEAARSDYDLASEMWELRTDVYQDIVEATRAEFADRTARAEAADPDAEAELF